MLSLNFALGPRGGYLFFLCIIYTVTLYLLEKIKIRVYKIMYASK
jgi:hypothetical protein